MVPSMALHKGDVVRITRPTGYTFLENTLVAFKNIVVGENGLDVMRVWSTDYLNPAEYYFTTKVAADAGTAISFGFRANLPLVPTKMRNWGFKTFRVLPLRDKDGEIVNATIPRYPWIGRPLLATGSNDGAFGGFMLVGKIPFTVQPQMHTPGAEIRLEVIFDLPAGADAEDNLRLELTAPAGFLFKAACLSGISAQFAKCTGHLSKATLSTVLPRLRGTDIKVNLGVINPSTTPVPNRWSLALFADEATQYENWSDSGGYELTAMEASYKGNNKMAEPASGFFTFTPVRTAPTQPVTIEVIPPPHYKAMCDGIAKVGLPELPLCTASSQWLRLTLTNGTVRRGETYTFGIGVLNPAARPLETQNFWAIRLRDAQMQTFDGNMRIQGMKLNSLPVRVETMGWSNPRPTSLCNILISLRMLHSIPGGAVTDITIISPEGVMYGDPSSLVVEPTPLPMAAVNPVTVGGNMLTLALDRNKGIVPATHNIMFVVNNPTRVPMDNTWTVQVKRDVSVEFQHVLAGFVYGQASPTSVVMPAKEGGAWRPSGHALCVSIIFGVLAMPWY